jgi:hypothetical protein
MSNLIYSKDLIVSFNSDVFDLSPKEGSDVNCMMPNEFGNPEA